MYFSGNIRTMLQRKKDINNIHIINTSVDLVFVLVIHTCQCNRYQTTIHNNKSKIPDSLPFILGTPFYLSSWILTPK